MKGNGIQFTFNEDIIDDLDNFAVKVDNTQAVISEITQKLRR